MATMIPFYKRPEISVPRALGAFKVRHSTALLVSLIVLLLTAPNIASAKDPIRVATLKFGTMNWVLDTIKLRKLDEKHGIKLKIIPLANTNGAKIALQGGSADVVGTDWTWISRRRAEGADYTLVPYSSAVGRLMVPQDSEIKSIEDLKGKKIGVAGGPLDKSWLFLRAYTQKQFGFDIGEEATPVYGAPPLLSQKVMRGEFDAILNFWHYSARLEAKNFRTLTSVGDIMVALGTSGPTCAVGFAFSEGWAGKNEKYVKSFLAAVRDAVAILDKDQAAWDDIRTRMKAKDDKTFHALRDAFRIGILRRPLIVEQADVGRLYNVLSEYGGKKLLGKASKLTPGTFWLTGDISQPVPQKKAL